MPGVVTRPSAIRSTQGLQTRGAVQGAGRGYHVLCANAF